DGHAAVVDGFARTRQFAIAAGFGGQVDHHAAGLHAFDHRRADDLRRGAPGHGGGTDDRVDVAHVFGEAALLFGALLVGQGARVTALARRAHAEVEEAAPQRFDLFARLGAHVEALDLRTEALGGGDGLQ